MNLEQIKAVVEAYRPTTVADDMERLEFFEGIWQIQQRHADAAGQAIDPSTLPGKEDVPTPTAACVASGYGWRLPSAITDKRMARPFFSMSPHNDRMPLVGTCPEP